MAVVVVVVAVNNLDYKVNLMKRIFILFVAGMVLSVCSGFVVKNPAGSIANQKAHDYYDKKNYLLNTMTNNKSNFYYHKTTRINRN